MRRGEGNLLSVLVGMQVHPLLQKGGYTFDRLIGCVCVCFLFDQSSRAIAGRQQTRYCWHEDGCTNQTSYGVGGSKKPEFCAKHAKEGMIDVIRKKCCHPGCTTVASYGFGGKKKPEFCSKHAKEGMVNVVSKRCSHPGCATQPSFGVDGSKKPEFCSKHAKDGMVGVMNKR